MSVQLNVGEFVNNYDVLTWSEDQRLALTLPRNIYIFNLVSGLRLQEGSGNDREPAVIVNIVEIPPDTEPFDVGVALPDPRKEVKAPIMKRFCDQKYFPRNTFKMSQWTPIGCNSNGGCLLTCLMAGGHVVLFSPPPSFGLHWKRVKVLSESLHDHWKKESYGDSSSCSNAFYDVDKRRKLLYITTFVWLPHVIKSAETSTVILAATTESRHVVFIRCDFDLLQGGITCSVDHMIELPDNLWGQGYKLACIKHNDDIFLSVGCSNGDVHLLFVGIAGADISYADAQPHPIIDGSDGIPVTTMVWERALPAADYCSLVIAKNQLIVVVHIPLMGGDISMHGVVEGHILPSSGLTSLPHGQFISCSRDKSIIEFSSSEYSSNYVGGKTSKQTNSDFETIKSRRIEVDLKGEPIGVAASHNGLFVAVVDLYEGVRNLSHSQCKVHFIKLLSGWSDLIGCYQELVAMETPLHLCWDVFESLRQLLHIDTDQNVNTLLSAKVLKPDGNNLYCLQLARMVVAYCEYEDIGGIDNFKLAGLDTHIIRNHIVTCLTSWLSYSESNNNHSAEELVVVSNMSGWLQVNGTADNELLKNEVVTRLTSLQCTVSHQQCPVCGEQLMWQSHNTLQCSNKHTWNSCMVTCAVLRDSTGKRCMQCGASTINVRSQGFKDSILLTVLDRHDCIRCGGSLTSL